MQLNPTPTLFLGLASSLLVTTAGAQQFPPNQPFPGAGGTAHIAFTASPEDFIIPFNGAHSALRLSIKGGRGGGANPFDNHCESHGGRAALLTADFLVGTGPGQLAPGGTLRYIVGQAGAEDDDDSTFAAGGGGGGTGVLYLAPNSGTWEPLLIAGGGGGGAQSVFGWACHAGNDGENASLTEYGTPGNNSGAGAGGAPGLGGGPAQGPGLGHDDKWGSGGGGGLWGEVVTQDPNINGSRGFPAGGAGGQGNFTGGWGCGAGGAAFSVSGDDPKGAGGGGGYSGGGGGGQTSHYKRPQGGGGGSFVASFADHVHVKAIYTGTTHDGFASLHSLGDAAHCGEAIEIFSQPVQNTTGTLDGAIYSVIPSVSDSCSLGSGLAGPDVWYTFTNNLPLERLLTFQNLSPLQLSIEQYVDCDSGQVHACGDPSAPSGAAFSVPPNETRYFRVETPSTGFVPGVPFTLDVAIDAIGPDSDGDTILDWFDLCIGDDTEDSDNDGIPNDCDPCFGSFGDCNQNGVGDSCDTFFGNVRHFELFNGSALPSAVLVGTNYTPSYVGNALKIGGATDSEFYGNAVFEPLTPTPVENVEFYFWVQSEPSPNVTPVVFGMFDADVHGSGTPVTGPGEADGLTVSLNQELDVFYMGTPLASVPFPFDFDDGTWREFLVRMNDGMVSVAYRLPNQGFFQFLLNPTPMPGWAPFRARYGVGTYSFFPIFQNQILLDQVFIQDSSVLFNKDIDGNGVPDSCEALSSTIEAGTPPNPVALGPLGFEAPVMGANYTLEVDHSTFHTGSAQDFLYASALPANDPGLFGTVLLSWPAPFSFAGPAGEPFTLPIPYDPVLLDLPLVFQALSWDPTSVGTELQFTNSVVAPIAAWRPAL